MDRSPQEHAPVASAPAAPSRTRRWGMAIDLDLCTGCGACVVGCRRENNVPIAGPIEAGKGRAIFWMDVLPAAEAEGEGEGGRRRFIPVPCNHCEHPACIKVCPVGATFQNEEGIVGQVYARCIGCRYCTTACPYTRRYFNWRPPSWEGESVQGLNPDVPIRPRGVVEKCTFCIQRVQAAKDLARLENRELRDGDVIPACQEVCPVGAIVFGDLNDPESKAAQLERSPRAFRLQEDLGTRPKVIYLSEAEWLPNW